MQALQVTIDHEPSSSTLRSGRRYLLAENSCSSTLLAPRTRGSGSRSSTRLSDGTDSFDANAAAKSRAPSPSSARKTASSQPWIDNYRTVLASVRPETPTPLPAATPTSAARGSWGSIFRVDLNESRNRGKISIFFLGDADHASFDNLTFGDLNTLLATEDRGDSLHIQLNTLDSVWAFSVREGQSPKRLIALGRDATSLAGGEDNEPTGLHVSNGVPLTFTQPGSLLNLLGRARIRNRQHGDNITFEIVKDDD